MSTRHDLDEWVLDALSALGGSGTIVDVCRWIWGSKRSDLETSGDLLYTWQYDVRWAVKRLRLRKKLKQAHESPRGTLTTRSMGLRTEGKRYDTHEA
jgi:hypothetical protein